MKTTNMTYARKCDCCGQGMNEGYVVNDGEVYYCSKECLNCDFTDEQWEEMYDDGNGDSYFTAWEDDSDDQYMLVNGQLVEIPGR